MDAEATSEQDDPTPSLIDSFERIDWVDVLATVVMAVAAILTAWSAFQSDQWGDQTSFSLAQGTAARTEADRVYTRAGQLALVDISSFFAWLEAIEIGAGSDTVGDLGPGYSPDPSTLSGALYLRFRPSFRAAADAWMLTNPFTDATAPSTPFAMPEYKMAEEVEAERLEREADAKYAEAQAADSNDDKYVLSTIVFAAVFLFAGLSTKMRSPLGQSLMLGLGTISLLGTAAYVFAIPILV